MASCDYCGSSILFGGTRVGEQRYCNARCHRAGQLIQVSQQYPGDVVQKQVWEVHQRPCPVCHGQGPVDVHMGYQVWSALVVTQWKSVPRVSCRSCGIKHQVSNLLISLVAGWWGFPWGLVLTPVQVGRNLFALTKGPDPMKPSAQLEKLVRMQIGQNALSARASGGA
jgi:hypothetical protein